jgi:hypothetical protein
MSTGKALGTSSNHSKFSLSIGLQTMYSHHQHLARYSMLPHSQPHVPTVKSHPKLIKDNIMLVYKFVTDRLHNTMEGNYSHPLH